MLKKIILEHTTAKFIEKLSELKAPPIYQLSPVDARRQLIDIQTKYYSAPLAAQIDKLEIKAGPTGLLNIQIIRPKNSTDKLPAIVYFHGGGWILGDASTHARLIHELAVSIHAAIIFVEFTPSPEAAYPTAIEQAYAALDYIANHAQELHLDASRIAVAGDSVGGNMATVTALLAHERGGPRVIYQLLLYPVTNAELTSGSYTEFANGPWLTKAAMEWFWNAYAPDISIRNGPLLSPIKATHEQLQVLPPTLIITAENDVLRDEGEAYAHKLMQAGVSVRAARFLGTIHDFLMLNALANTAPTRAAMTLIVATMRQIFYGDAA